MPTFVLSTPVPVGTPGQAAWTDSTLIPGAGVDVQDEGGLILAGTQTLNFTGPGVTAAQTGPSTVAITIPGGGGAIAVWDQQIFVAAGANAGTADGSVALPFASISAAQATILDAAPGKRYAIVVSAGEYTEAAPLLIKPNVFIVGATRSAVRITAPSYGFDPSFTGAADNRSGFTDVVLIGASTYDWNAVTSTAGKLYFDSVVFNSAITLTGTNGTIPQASFAGCQLFGAFAVQGVNVGIFNDNLVFNNITLTQSLFVVPTILTATGGYCSGSVSAVTAVVNFNRRISIFARSFWMGAVTIDGASTYLDYTVDSLPAAGATVLNGANLISIDTGTGADKNLSNLNFPTAVNNPIIPAATNATNFGDWGFQWFWSFAFLHASTGTDCYLISYPSAFGAETGPGKNVFIVADGAGLAANVDGGIVGMYTNNASGTGNSGLIEAETGTSVNGNTGNIRFTTGTPSGTGRRGTVVVNSPLTHPYGTIAVAAPNSADLRTHPAYLSNQAAITLPTMLAADDGLRIEIVTSVPGVVTPPSGAGNQRNMSTRGGSTWIWINSLADWLCISAI